MLDLFAEVFRGAAYHESGDEDRENAVQQDSVEAGAHASENNFTGHDVEERDQTSQGSEAVVRRIHRAATCVGGRGGKQRRIRNTEADLLALHIAAGLSRSCSILNPQVRQNGIAGLLEMVYDEYADQEHDGERGENGPALSGISYHLPERVRQRTGNEEDQKHL